MKKVFDRRLYIEGLLQLKTMGIVFLTLMLLEGVLLPIGRFIEVLQNSKETVVSVYQQRPMDLISVHPASFLMFCVVVPILTLSLFRFLNRRASSDFYHAIPQTRTCLYGSFTAAILTWTLAIQWISLIVDIVLHSMLLGAGTMLIGKMFLQSISIDVMCLLVIGAILIAMSITGTIFGNVIVTGVILFVPRLLMLLIQRGVGDSLVSVNSEYLYTFMGNGWNMLTGFIYSLFCSGNVGGYPLLVDGKSLVYTLLLAILHLAAGGWFFTRRRSEAAGQTSYNTFVQGLLCLAPAFIFSMIPNMLLFDELSRGYYIDLEDAYNYFLLYLAAVVLYFVFHLITTGKLRNLARAVPGVLILALLNVAMVGGMCAMRSSLLDFTPAYSQIDSVVFESATRYVYSGSGDVQIKGYLSSRVNQVALTDTEIRKITADGLSNAIDYDKNGDNSVNRAYEYVSVEIRCGKRSYHRNIMVYTEDQRAIAEALGSNEQFRDIYMKLPQVDDPNMSLYGYNMEEEYTKEVYAAMLLDVEEMGFENWYAYCSSSDYAYYLSQVQDEAYTDVANNYIQLASINMSYLENMETTGCNFPISTATPHAAKKYLEVTELNTENAAEALTMLEKVDQMPESQIESGYGFFDGMVYTLEDGKVLGNGYFSMDLSEEEDRNLAETILKAQTDSAAADPDGGMRMYLNINLDYQNGDIFTGMSLEGAVTIPKDLEEVVKNRCY